MKDLQLLFFGKPSTALTGQGHAKFTKWLTSVRFHLHASNCTHRQIDDIYSTEDTGRRAGSGGRTFIQNIWYAAAWSDALQDNLLGRTIAGESIVFFRTNGGSLTAVSDTCPHRFAPLHRGRKVADGIECGYHGLRFSAQGTCIHNPHGPVPRAARLKSYPAVELDGLIWVWIGEEASANIESITRFPWLSDTNYTFTGGHTMPMKLSCELIVDNLLDLSHAAYLHPATLGAAQGTKDIVSVARTGNRLQSDRIIPDSPPAAVFVATGAAPPDLHVDYWANMRWDPPGTFYMDAGIVPTGQAKASGRILSSVQIITPATATSSYYHWKMFRNYRLDDTAITQAIEAAVVQAFTTEDEPMISAVQERMAGQDFWSMKPLLLSSDSAAVLARRIVSQLMESQTRTMASSTTTEAVTSSE